ncbi:hypothetical protein KBD45_00480 [Candidatus Dojkabacteria bacterium]|nr:hypothetical protein [Candidatus Dojkabacteria bacterium]
MRITWEVQKRILVIILLIQLLLLIVLSFEKEENEINILTEAEVETQLNPNLIDGKPVVRIVNFNPGPGHVGNRDRREQAWIQLAEHLVALKAEIVLIQEPGKAELAMIRRILEPTFPYSRWIRYPEGINNAQDIQRGGEINPIFSKYPFVEGTQQEWEISPSDKERDKDRVVLSVDIQTPYGVLRTVNFHTHGDTQCADAYKALEPLTNPASIYYNPPQKNFIITGDFNIALSQVLPAYDPNIRNSGALLIREVCDYKYSNRYVNVNDLEKLIKENYKAYCLDPNTCLNRQTIEMVWSLNNNPIDIYTMGRGDSKFQHIFEDVNKHPLVFADIGDPNWVLPSISTISNPNPSETPSLVSPIISPVYTPEPIVSPIEEQLLIDLNEDGQVDITDFALFVEYYKVGNVKIDYDEDGKILRDVGDLDYFIKNYREHI